MSTAEIIAELGRLSAAELAQVEAKLRELVRSPSSANRTNPAPAAPRIFSPRLARAEDAKDFTKQVVELSADDQGILGRDVLASVTLVFNGPAQEWTQHPTTP